MKRFDFYVERDRSICVLQPTSRAAMVWIAENVDEEALWYAGGLVIEPRYLDDLVLAMEMAGLKRERE